MKLPTQIMSAQELFQKALHKHASDTDKQFVKRPLVRAAVWEKTSGICWYCGKKCNPWIDFTVDHVIPSASNGDVSFENLVPCCRNCNLRKHSRSIEELRIALAKEHIANGIKFSEEQIAFLEKHGVSIFSAIAEYRFYFERQIERPAP